MNNSIAILGAGSWGTALAILLARNGQNVHLWGHMANEMAQMSNERCNNIYLPGFAFPESIQIAHDIESLLQDASINTILIAVPSHAFRNLLKRIQPHYQQQRIIWVTKGIDAQGNCLLHQVVTEELGSDVTMALLSGPSFAKEVAAGMPTAVTLASNSSNFSQDLMQYFHSKNFRIYLSEDIIGVEVGGSIKNILAIATGLSTGLGYGANAQAALITRGLAEIIRLGVHLGSKTETFMGLAGMGDLVLTCSDNQSRNRRFGLALGQGKSVEQAKADIAQVIEGIENAGQVQQLAQQAQIEMPICNCIYRIIYENLDPKIAVDELLSRTTRQE